MEQCLEMFIKGTFDSAHFLPLYMGKCSVLHGHTFKYTVCFTGKLNKETGMIIDFKKAEEEIKSVINELDHNNLNNILETPTCENILIHLKKKLLCSTLAVNLVYIELWETDKYGGRIYA